MRLVHEDFFAPVVGDDEPEPFGRVEPFNCAFLVVGEERGIRRRFAIGLGDMEKIQFDGKKSIVKFERVKKALPRDILPHAPTPVFFDIDLELSESPKVSFVIVLLSGTDGEIFN